MSQDKIVKKNIFITGGSGFIGSWLIARLIQDNKVWCYDNARRVSAKFTELSRHRNLTFVKGDILDKDNLKSGIPKRLDIVVHLAAIAGVSSYYDMPLETMQVNLIGTYNLLELMKNKDLDIFIDFSTSEVYGRYAKGVSEADDTVQGPVSDRRWTYGISKLAAESLAHCYHYKYDLPVASIRPFNIYGPLQIGEGAIRIFVSNAVRNKTLSIHGDGSQVRAWCYIEDLVEGVFGCMKNRDAAIGSVFNLGNPNASISILDLAKKIIKIAGSKSKLCFRKETRTDIEYRMPDISKAKKLIGYSPSVSLTEGLKRTVEWYRTNPI